MRGLPWVVAIALVLPIGGVATAFAQQTTGGADQTSAPTLAQVDPEQADRQALRDLLGRTDVRQVARMARIDLAQDEIRLSATVVIIILLLIIIIIVAA
jgi:hypothetical protein